MAEPGALDLTMQPKMDCPKNPGKQGMWPENKLTSRRPDKGNLSESLPEYTRQSQQATISVGRLTVELKRFQRELQCLSKAGRVRG